MTHGSLFSGIDGFSLAAKWMGWGNLFHCEKNEILLKFLEKKYPKSKGYADITKTDFSIWRGKIDILTGGFPCQPFSVAGKRKGTDDDRHLWPEMLRAIREIKPKWIVGENVRGLLNWDAGVVFEQVLTDLEAEGYEITPFLLPACAVNAPHRRDRIFFIAYTKCLRSHEVHKKIQPRLPNGYKFNSYGIQQFIANTQSQQGKSNQFKQSKDRQQKTGKFRRSNCEKDFKRFWKNFPTQPPICTGNDGVSTELLRTIIRNNTYGLLTEKEENDIISKTISRTRKEIIQAGGNAVVPPLILQIFKSIEKFENEK